MAMCSPISTPGSQALEAARSIKDLSIFKKPRGIPKRGKRFQSTILDEETYIERMGDIIQRDFFPHLEKLKAQNDYLDALEQNDAKRMRELYEKYSSRRPATDRLSSPSTWETPQREEQKPSPLTNIADRADGPSSSEQVEGDVKMGLDSYLSGHTSEDNASFEEMMVEAEQRQRVKYAWLYDKEEESKILALEADTNSDGPGRFKKPRPLLPDTWGYKNKNYIMYIPDGVELTVDEQIEMAKSKQEVMHVNTRLTVNPFNEQQNKEALNELAKSQSRANDGKIGVDGREVVTHPTPRVNGFGFVATPSPRPGECESPLMTWGQIEGTPFRLDGGDTPLLRSTQGPSFRMAEPPKREKIALQLAEKAGERHRDRKNKALEAARRSFATPSPRTLSTIDRLNTMSPAARRLATQKLKISSPSPRRTPLRTPLSGIKASNSGTRTVAVEDAGRKGLDSILTDNLLQLPQRQRAADFFD